MKCYRIYEEGKFGKGKIVDMPLEELKPGGVQIKVHYSSVNFKDALAGLGRGKILKDYPLNGGIDAAGVVSRSNSSDFKEGDFVLVNGCTLSEFSDGGYSEYVNVSPEWVVPLPKGLSLKEAMIFGTAGFTAALCLHRMLLNGQKKEMGPIAVTGASGGVGGIALMLLRRCGFTSLAITGKEDLREKLMSWGADEVKSLSELKLGHRPLEKGLFGGAIDNLGGEVLSQVLAHVNLWGNVASVGLALDSKLETTVMPFILRGVSLLGASSNNCESSVRKEIWEKLGAEWRPDNLTQIVYEEVCLEELEAVFEKMMNRETWGRTVVRIGE